VAPPKALDEELLRRVASLTGKEIPDARLLLAGEIPRIIASVEDAGAAKAMARGLGDAGLVAFVCGEAELRHRSPGFAAHAVKPKEGGVLFRDRPGGELRVEPGDVFLILRGRKTSAAQETTSTTKMKLNVTATVLTGLPVIHPVTRKTTQESFRAEGFVSLFDRRSSDPRVEMFQNHLDYAFLGPELAPSAPANFEILVEKLRHWFPLAIFDDRLTRASKINVPIAGPEAALEINGKLIYLSYLAMERVQDQ
jgi:hypothetical protein